LAKKQFRNGLSLWQIWLSRVFKEQLPENQTAFLSGFPA